jgi:hypothetical protein
MMDSTFSYSSFFAPLEFWVPWFGLQSDATDQDQNQDQDHGFAAGRRCIVE